MSRTTGSTFPNLSSNELRNLMVPTPQRDEQVLLAEIIESQLSYTEKAEQAVELAFKQTAGLRHGILSMAFQGELVPQDPRDEPAVTQFKRIKSPNSNLASLA